MVAVVHAAPKDAAPVSAQAGLAALGATFAPVEVEAFAAARLRRRAAQAENLRKTLLAMVGDIRVVITRVRLD